MTLIGCSITDRSSGVIFPKATRHGEGLFGFGYSQFSLMNLFLVTVPSFFSYIQLVFAAFTGEAWGHLGSRKFLQELDLGSDSIKGLNSSMIEQVVII